MTPQHLVRLFDHVSWADRRTLALLRGPGGGAPEVVRLYAHLLAAERVWLLRLRGEDSSVQPIWPELGLEEIEALRAQNETEWAAYVRSLEAEDLDREVEYANSTGARFRSRVFDVLMQVALHGSYHRGQIAREVRRAGGEPVNTDFITFARETPWGEG
jgi:uncharacterized damage-inducible protein DinB